MNTIDFDELLLKFYFKILQQHVEKLLTIRNKIV